MPKSTQKKGIKQLTTAIKENETKLAINRRINTKTAIKQGELFIDLKKVVKKEKKSFQKFCKKTFPDLLPKTIQRYMLLARHVDVGEHPALSALSQNQLNRLIILNGKSDVGKYLEDNDITLNFAPEDLKESAELKAAVDNFIKPKQKSATTSEKKIKSSPANIALQTVHKWAGKKIAAQSPLQKKTMTQIKELLDLLTELLDMSNSGQ
ncbi:MAG: hypothetical protein KKI15_02400 [Proteobacteria bacterium]|nr:hypothetical protein [Pseudomonadota bacterium]